MRRWALSGPGVALSRTQFRPVTLTLPPTKFGWRSAVMYRVAASFSNRALPNECTVEDRLLHDIDFLRIASSRHGEDGIHEVLPGGKQLLVDYHIVGGLRVQVEKISYAQARMFFER